MRYKILERRHEVNFLHIDIFFPFHDQKSKIVTYKFIRILVYYDRLNLEFLNLD